MCHTSALITFFIPGDNLNEEQMNRFLLPEKSLSMQRLISLSAPRTRFIGTGEQSFTSTTPYAGGSTDFGPQECHKQAALIGSHFLITSYINSLIA